MSGVGEAVEHLQQFTHVVKVQSSCGLVQHIQRGICGAISKLGGQFNSLRLAARKRGTGLPKLHVAQAHVANAHQHGVNARVRFKERDRVVNGHIQYFGDSLVLETNIKRFLGVARSVAGFAGHKNIWQEMHLNLAHALALANFAAAAFHVERKSTRFVAANAALGNGGEQLANIIKNPRVSGWI